MKKMNVTGFSCGVKDIDEFIQKEALDFEKERLGVTYLFVHDKELVGFATLSMADLKREKMEAEDRPELKIENYPALLIGQLAVCEKLQGQDVGTFICDFCFDRALRLSKRVGCRFMVVNAVESALGFYEKYGFVLLPKQEAREQKIMFLDISKAI
jgi:GNAT superfamily N-acetyltransferase